MGGLKMVDMTTVPTTTGLIKHKDLMKTFPTLIDRFGRQISYLRLSVTDRCDLRCAYCIPKGFRGFEVPAHWLNFAEIERLMAIFVRSGVSRIRLTGGEPLLRAQLPLLARRLAALPGLEELSLSTNATRLEDHAQALRDAGVSRVNISLDSLIPEQIKCLTGQDAFAKIMAGIDAAQQVGFSPIKINMVIVPGVNDREIDDMVAFCRDHRLILRLIEPMPMGDSGRTIAPHDLQETRQRLTQRFDLIPALIPGDGPAYYLQDPEGTFNVGFITPISRHFCATCNRVRLTVDGILHLCLGQEARVDFRTLMRSGASDEELTLALRAAVELKPERHEFREFPEKIMRFMSSTGG